MTALENTGGDLVPFKGKMITRAEIPTSSRVRPVAVQSMDDALRYAKVIAASGLLPKSFYAAGGDPTAMAFAAIQLGAEVGLSPMASVQNIAVINGKPALYGPGQLAVCEASGLMEEFEEGLRGDGAAREAWCTVKRAGRKAKTVIFSMADAGRANLTGKRGPWTEYPDRMLLARARTFALRDTFPDVLLGLAYSVEELQDVHAEQPRGHIEHEPAPPAEPAAAVKPKPPIKVKVPGQPDAEFTQADGLPAALKAALDFMSGAILDGGAAIVAANAALLDRIAERLPDMAEAVADLRAAAVMADDAALSDPDAIEAEDPDEFPGDIPAPGDAP